MDLDLRYAFRRLARARGFTLAAALTIALGVGANSAIFSVVNAVVLRPPAAVAEPERLVGVFTSDYSGPRYGSSSLPDVEDFGKLGADVFSGVTSYSPRPSAIGVDDNLERVGVEIVSPNYFQVLGALPVLGRPFAPEENVPHGEAVAVISHALWQRRFAADPAIVGKPLRLNAREFTIIGVAPRGFHGSLRGLAVDAWVPASLGAYLGMSESSFTSRGDRGALVYARLRPGVTIEQAQARMNVVARQLTAAYPDYWTDVTKQGRRITLLPERETRIPPQIRGPALGFVALLMATVALVLLVCCANVAELLLARAAGRLKEVGIRISLGASRGRIVRQMLLESVLLAALGGVAGTAAAVWAGRALMTAAPALLPVPIALDLRPDFRVLAFTLGVTLITGLVFGLAPALRSSRADVVSALKTDVPAMRLGRRRFSLQGALVVGQVSLSLLLLVGALLFLRTLRSAASIDPGFRTDHLLLLDIAPRPGEEGRTSLEQVALSIRDRVAAIPGVRQVSWAGAVPLGLDASRRQTMVEGYRPRDGEDMEFHYNVVGPRYFETMEIPLVRGRGFTDQDRQGAPPVVVVNEAFARKFWGDAEPLGKRLSISGDAGPWLEVIGVARDGKYVSITESPRPYVFFPALQVPGGLKLHVRTTGDPRQLVPAVRREVAAVAPTWMAERPRTLEESVGASLLPQRIAAGMLSGFGVVALLLAAIGLYGVVAFAVAQRTREIGIRVALGAQQREVLRLMLRQGMMLAAIGLALGLPMAFAAGKLVSGFLLGTSASDPVVFLGAGAALGIVTLVASYVPARRAARVDPMVALRAQ